MTEYIWFWSFYTLSQTIISMDIPERSSSTMSSITNLKIGQDLSTFTDV